MKHRNKKSAKSKSKTARSSRKPAVSRKRKSVIKHEEEKDLEKSESLAMSTRLMVRMSLTRRRLLRVRIYLCKFPTDDDEGVAYSSHEVIVRDSYDQGHAWDDLSQPNLLDVVSIASLSVLPKPVLPQDHWDVGFANLSDRSGMERSRLPLSLQCR